MHSIIAYRVPICFSLWKTDHMVYCSILKLLIEGFSLVNQHLPGFAGSFLCALGCRPLSGHSSTAGNAAAVLLHSQPPKASLLFFRPRRLSQSQTEFIGPAVTPQWPWAAGGWHQGCPEPLGGPRPSRAVGAGAAPAARQAPSPKSCGRLKQNSPPVLQEWSTRGQSRPVLHSPFLS